MKIPILTSIFFRWVGKNHQLGIEPLLAVGPQNEISSLGAEDPTSALSLWKKGQASLNGLPRLPPEFTNMTRWKITIFFKGKYIDSNGWVFHCHLSFSRVYNPEI